MNTAAVKPSARDALASVTRERAMEAVAAILRAGGEVTFDAVSREAAVPARTLYRHFATKDALFEAFWPWMNARIEMPDRPRDAAELVAHIPALFAAFDRDEPLVRAILHHPQGQATRLAHAAARREKFSGALSEITKSMSKPQADRLLAAVTALCSAAGWETMRDNWGLSGADAAGAAQWALQVLIDEARGRKGVG